MKKIYLTAIITAIVSLQAYSQKSISVNYGFISSELIRFSTIAGGGGFTNNNTFDIGVRYTQSLTKKLSLETGVSLLKTNIEISSEFPGIENKEEELSLISIPIYINYDLKKNFYINTGISLDFQSEDQIVDNQTGLGVLLGIGKKFYFDNYYFLINPIIEMHSLVPFKKENYHQKLFELGAQIGFGYEF